MKKVLGRAVALKQTLDRRSNKEVLLLLAITTFTIPIPGASLPVILYAGHRWTTRSWRWVTVRWRIFSRFFANRIFCLRHSMEELQVAFCEMPGFTSPWRDPVVTIEGYGEFGLDCQGSA